MSSYNRNHIMGCLYRWTLRKASPQPFLGKMQLFVLTIIGMLFFLFCSFLLLNRVVNCQHNFCTATRRAHIKFCLFILGFFSFHLVPCMKKLSSRAFIPKKTVKWNMKNMNDELDLRNSK